MFQAKERITIDGRLAAFEGETMSDEEAEARGITAHLAKRSKGDAAPKKTEKQLLVEEAEELGVEVPKNATASKIKELIEQHKAALAASDTGDGDEAGAGDGKDGGANAENE